MVYGIGIDLVNLKRFKKAHDRWGERLLNRLFSDKEVEECKKKRRTNDSLAGKFAAKEAVLKAVGTGLSQGITWKQIEILDDETGQPQVFLYQNLKSLLKKQGIKDCYVSISHEKKYAVAQAILVKRN